MDTKIVVITCLLGVASAGVLAPVAPLPLARVDPFPQYSYGYDVQDALTGDYKGHQEQRNGDLVTGSYTVVDPDGTRRIVDYSADPLNGFNAVVRREPLVVAAPARVVAPAPVLAPAPVVGPAPLVAPAPVYRRAPIFAPAPAPLLAPRLPSPYFL
ncbi:larval cuticle protein A2B-like [Plodia interpunctella]|uniref:larval cuticle protein A2B-like n=1 Tax=Plodia interpunctella TaxID=58824 RepID=UPI0023676E10|nr:larval cuticle protein A2B-like [Plodia interpunctella]